jgi:uncharacterized membrane protein
MTTAGFAEDGGFADLRRGRVHGAVNGHSAVGPARSLLGLAAGAVALLATPSASLAQFQVCNKTSAKEIYVALGLHREGKGWQSEGWYTIARRQCSALVDKMTGRYYYLYVESDNDTVWDGGDDDDSSNFCVRPGRAFTLGVTSLAERGDNPNCEKHGYVTKRFMRVDTERYGDYTFEISD